MFLSEGVVAGVPAAVDGAVGAAALAHQHYLPQALRLRASAYRARQCVLLLLLVIDRWSCSPGRQAEEMFVSRHHVEGENESTFVHDLA